MNEVVSTNFSSANPKVYSLQPASFQNSNSTFNPSLLFLFKSLAVNTFDTLHQMNNNLPIFVISTIQLIFWNRMYLKFYLQNRHSLHHLFYILLKQSPSETFCWNFLHYQLPINLSVKIAQLNFSWILKFILVFQQSLQKFNRKLI